jgi:hypothetical protein
MSLVLDDFASLELSITVAFDGFVVDKNISTLLGFDKPETLGIVEPLYDALFHEASSKIRVNKRPTHPQTQVPCGRNGWTAPDSSDRERNELDAWLDRDRFLTQNSYIKVLTQV